MIIFLHIPKSGGTSLITSLANIYGDKFVRVHSPNFGQLKSKYQNSELRLPEKCEIVSGHFSFGWHEVFKIEKFNYFSIMREPVSRVISHYFYVLKNPHHRLHKVLVEKGYSLEEYVSSGLVGEVNNGQARLLSGIEEIQFAPYGEDKVKYGSNSRELFELAKRNIDNSFDFVGILEKYDDCLFLLKEYYGIEIQNEKLNEGSYKDELATISPRQIEVIKEYNKIDIDLYEYCVQKFDFQIEQMRK